MGLKKVVRIETYDTKKTYEFISGQKDENPDLWEVGIFVSKVRSDGSIDGGLYNKPYPKKVIYLERETLEKSGLIPGKRRNEPKPEPTETVEDLILRLLEYVGIYPQE
jgi:hypothetical protein